MEENYNGILIIDKSEGLTSRDVVNRVSHILHTKKIGHTGTLDPLATGVLILTIGKFTKLSDFLTSSFKTYVVEALLGYETDTLDITGKTTKTSEVKINEEEIKNVILSYIGSYDQEVPAYSAVKINGKKLYEYARENKEIELPKRNVTIKSITDIEIDGMNVKFTCVVSKGTYIRSLIRDIGASLKSYGTMKSLRRITQGNFTIDDACTLEDIEKGNFKLLELDDILKSIPIINMNDLEFKQVSNGVKQTSDIDSDYIAYKYNGKYIALYKKENDYFRMYIKF